MVLAIGFVELECWQHLYHCFITMFTAYFPGTLRGKVQKPSDSVCSAPFRVYMLVNSCWCRSAVSATIAIFCSLMLCNLVDRNHVFENFPASMFMEKSRHSGAGWAPELACMLQRMEDLLPPHQESKLDSLSSSPHSVNLIAGTTIRTLVEAQCYQPRINLVRMRMETCLQTHTMLWVDRRIYFCQILNVRGVNDVWET
jgi:hypothetical protein